MLIYFILIALVCFLFFISIIMKMIQMCFGEVNCIIEKIMQLFCIVADWRFAKLTDDVVSQEKNINL